MIMTHIAPSYTGIMDPYTSLTYVVKSTLDYIIQTVPHSPS